MFYTYSRACLWWCLILAQPLKNKILSNTALSLCWENAYLFAWDNSFQLWIYLPSCHLHPWGTFCFSLMADLHLVQAIKSKVRCEVALLPELWESKIWSWVLWDPEPRMTVLARDSSNLPDQPTEQDWALMSTQNSSHPQLTAELNPGPYELSGDHRVPS
jgi:hypothetical protein